MLCNSEFTTLHPDISPYFYPRSASGRPPSRPLSGFVHGATPPRASPAGCKMAYTSLRLNGTIKPYIEESKTSTTVARNGGATVGDCGADVPNGHSNGHVIRGSAQDKHSVVVPTLTKR